MLQRFLAMAMICLVIWNGHAQNLIPNHSMEEYGPCPTNWTLPGGTLSCQPWIIPTGGTSDYFNACAILPVADVPDNFIGHQFAYTGDAYCGIIVHTFIPQYREYLQIQLTQPLQAGSTYRVSFQVSLADMGCPVAHLGAYISVVAPTANNANVLNVVPQIETNGGLLNNSLSWVEISGCYLASGGEEYITIGSFRNDANTILDPACTFDYAYYYVDHVVLDTATPGELMFDLGGPVEECGEYTINPGIPSGYFNWSDGSHGTTLTVTESGTYSVTITSGCDTGEDEIDVVILENEELELEDLVSFCDGDSYTVELEPTMGQYTWDDGSHELEYVITTEGTYGVTLENFCGTFSDAVVVDVLYPPLPVTLGNDTILCDEETLELYFDPALGDFLWSTGSTDNEIEFDEAGEYSLTISNTCGEETDDLEIEVVLFPEIQINPDELILCEGEEFEIELDPDIGNYIWQDGETSPTYLITEAGLYSVTVSNFCGANYEEILVLTPDPPQLDLGEDVTICPSQLPYSFDDPEIGAVNLIFYLPYHSYLK